MDSRAVVLLTTWNRPNLLRQSLPQILWEAKEIGADLVISDDGSDDPDTLKILSEAEAEGVVVISRDYDRSKVRRHDATGLNNIFAFNYLCENYPKAELFIKVDDDTYHAKGSFRKMLPRRAMMFFT